ncbi:MAG TPA: DEAD/DEAH box helicase, partial [Candidatus Acidoferrum sp.]
MSSAFCNVALPVPLRTTFTYAVPEGLRGTLQPGTRVLVPFRKKSMVGVVVDMTDQPPANTKVREITKVMEFEPALTPKLMELAQWIGNYYLAPIGEVFRAMLPPVAELNLRREIILTSEGRSATGSLLGGEISHGLTAAEAVFLEKANMKKGPILFSLAAKMGVSSAALQRLRQRDLIEIRESLEDRKRKSQTIVAWKGFADKTEETLKEKEEKVRLLLETERGPLPMSQLLKLARVSRSLVERMLAGGLLESWQEPVDPAEDPFDVGYTPAAHALNEEQERAMKSIRARFELGEFGVQLLHGVTGSGKTEVYLRCVQETLARGKTAIILVPEIALTLWIGRQCRSWFGAKYEGVAVLHSALSDVQRAREWWLVRNGGARVVVGTRSAVFAPLENLGLIIVDEEQENSYKQEETPRYHGRDVAIVRAKSEGALALLGSATPSLETYHHARNGKYDLLRMYSRVENRS